MIPRVIHYCWFGGKPLPPSAERCIASWRKYLPDCEIRRWDESNFDINIIPYTARASEAGKWAFVSDYARMWILHRHGGIYFDTDVEVIAPMDDILERGPFMGIELVTDAEAWIAPGLGIAAEKNSDIYAQIMQEFEQTEYDGHVGIVQLTTRVLKAHGLRRANELQQVGGIWVYPSDYFNPLDDATGRLVKTANTRSIHWYSKTWVNNYSPLRTRLTRLAHRWFGIHSLAWLKRVLRK